MPDKSTYQVIETDETGYVSLITAGSVHLCLHVKRTMSRDKPWCTYHIACPEWKPKKTEETF